MPTNLKGRGQLRQQAIRRKVVLGIVAALSLLTVAYAAISYVLFRQYVIDDSVVYARAINALVADVIDADCVEGYLAQGRLFPGYEDIEARLYRLRELDSDVRYLYVYQIREDGCHVVFDLDTSDVPAAQPGDVVKFERPLNDRIDDLLAGREIDPVISNERPYGYLLTVYTPIYNSAGRCACYAAVDISMDVIGDYAVRFVANMLAAYIMVVLVAMLVTTMLAERGVVRPIAHIEGKAYRDSLTGLGNKAAYSETAAGLDKEIETGKASFAILMIDVNFLKRMNDTYGHDKGDMYLKTCVETIGRAFGKERAYRVGGDEFVVVLQGEEMLNASSMVREFKDEVARMAADPSLEEWERVSAAVGMASYDAHVDTCVQDVFERADAAMYEDKIAMKAQRTD